MLAPILVLAGCLQLAAAHFSVDYPFWRGDSMKTQWTRPCGGVNVTTNRTEWPLDGGSLLFEPSHPWAITYVNLALGTEEPLTFNVSLVPPFNQTGNGTFCFPKLSIPSGTVITPGTNASIQVIQLTTTGSALYNCADITFVEGAELLAQDRCTNSTGIGWEVLHSMSPNATTTGAAPSSYGHPAHALWVVALGVLAAVMM